MAELQLETPSADPIATSRAKLAAAEEYIMDQLTAKKVALKLAGDQEVQLPVSQVQLLTGISATNNTLDLRVEVPDLNVVGERKVADSALDVLKTIPVLARNFNLELKAPDAPGAEAAAPKTDENSLPPVVFSWGPDMKTVDIKFTFSKETDPLAIVDEIYAMRVARDQERLRAANQAVEQAPTININNTVVNSGPVGDAVATAAPLAVSENAPVTVAAPQAVADTASINAPTSTSNAAAASAADGGERKFADESLKSLPPVTAGTATEREGLRPESFLGRTA